MTCDCVLRFAVTATTSTTNTSPHSPLQYVTDSPSTERDGQDGGGWIMNWVEVADAPEMTVVEESILNCVEATEAPDMIILGVGGEVEVLTIPGRTFPVGRV